MDKLSQDKGCVLDLVVEEKNVWVSKKLWIACSIPFQDIVS